jgi:hypothetical protein
MYDKPWMILPAWPCVIGSNRYQRVLSTVLSLYLLYHIWWSAALYVLIVCLCVRETDSNNCLVLLDCSDVPCVYSMLWFAMSCYPVTRDWIPWRPTSVCSMLLCILLRSLVLWYILRLSECARFPVDVYCVCCCIHDRLSMIAIRYNRPIWSVFMFLYHVEEFWS